VSLISINSLSGGKTSSYMAANYWADYDIFSLVRIQSRKFKDEKVRQYVEDKLQKPFIGTSEEDTIVYTMLDLEQHIGRPITWVTGPTFEEVIENKGGYLPNKMARYCTTELKTLPILQWVIENLDDVPVMRFGYRANEGRRVLKMQQRATGLTLYVKASFEKHADGRNKWREYAYCIPEFPLYEDEIYKDQVENYWKDQPVRFAYMNNCVGCFWRSPLLLHKMYQKDAEKMDWFNEQEQKTGNRWRSDVTYEKIKNFHSQIELFDNDFNECDSGNCGI
jgi:hypothetical protein